MTKACTVCSKSFASEQALQAHMNATKHNARANLQRQSESSKAKPQFYCGMCEKAFAEKAYLQQHMSYHVMPPLSFKCSKMPEVFPHLGSTTTASERLFSLRWSPLGSNRLLLRTQTPQSVLLTVVLSALSHLIILKPWSNIPNLAAAFPIIVKTARKSSEAKMLSNNHIELIHSVQERPSRMIVSRARRYSRPQELLNAHKESSVKAPVSPYSCFACAKFFKSETEAQKHMAKAHGVCSSAPRK